MIVHEVQKNFKCDSCGKSFTSSECLIIHEAQRNYNCESCGKYFGQSVNLMYIKAIHEGQWNYTLH